MCGAFFKPVKHSDMRNIQQQYNSMKRFLRFQRKMLLVWQLLFISAVCAPFFVVAFIALRMING